MKSLAELKADSGFQKFAFYRIFGIERLFQLLNEQSLALLAPRKWEDPYEEALQNMLETKNAFRIYGLCWSSRPRSDALWRIYSPNSLGVRVSTTIGHLTDAIIPGDSFSEDNLFVGSVSYIPEITDKVFDFGKAKLSLQKEDFNRTIVTISDAIKDMLTDRDRRAQRSEADIAKTFLVKRYAFNHESEVRFIYVDRGQNTNNGIYKIPINPLKLIRSIQFDPRMDDDVFKSLKEAVIASAGTNKIRITKSDLYKSPEQLISPKKKKVLSL